LKAYITGIVYVCKPPRLKKPELKIKHFSMELTGKNIVGSKLVATGTTTFYAEEPITGKKLDTAFIEATVQEVDQAVQKAGEAFHIYRKKSGKERAAFLEAIADEIVAIGDPLIKRCMQESGLPEARLTGERGRTVNQLKLFATLLREGSWVDARIDTALPDRTPLPRPDIRSMQKGLGPVGVFGASNFPLAFSVAGGDTASALAAGCTVVVKAHPAHPGTCELVGLAIQRAIQKTNMPEGTFSMVHGKSVDTGLAIVRHPLITAIGFTGSFRGGKALFDEAAKRPVPIPVYAEMGSTNPVFILPGALKERKEAIAKELSASVTLGTGQFCTNPGLTFLLQSEEEKAFKELLSGAISAINAGPMLTEGILSAYNKGIDTLKSKKGVTTLAKGKKEGEGFYAEAHVLQADIDNFRADHALEEEVFGPSTLAITARSKEDLFQAVDNLKGHLTATIIGTEQDLTEYAGLIEKLELKVGRIIINGYPTGVEVCHAMVHGGPYPATTASNTTSVGTTAITRFTRPVCYQGFSSALLPEELKEGNPLGIWRLVNGEQVKN
jgi:2,5-dioxopentanoate dehydrogenase